mgnify:CR=1 FL=1
MKKIIISGLVAGVVLLILSIIGLYITLWFLPDIAMQYFNPAFNDQSKRYIIYIIHPFIISFALSWFWSRFRTSLKGSFITRGIEFGLIYMIISVVPFMLMLYSTIDVSLAMLGTWFVFGAMQGFISGLVFGKMNP